MSSFTESEQKQSIDSYLSVSEEELLERLNRNPGGNQSEFHFMSHVLAVRIARTNRELNQALVNETRRLVYASWAVCGISILSVVITSLCK